MKTTKKILCLIAIAFSQNAFSHPDTKAFSSTFVKAPEVIDCTLENGDTTQCYEMVVPYQPKDLEIGPFCPPTLAEEGGLWDWDGENAGLYRLNKEFLEMISGLGYTFYDENKNVSVVDVRLDRPSNDQNSCLSASGDESVEMTVRLPVKPVMAEKPTSLGTVAKVGIALDGVPIFADAPSVLDRGHLPALDVCGGHIDPGGWYHWHATTTDIETALKTENVDANCKVAQDASALFGYAFDGFPMYGSKEADGSTPIGLDECNGHEVMTKDNEKSYHYHASETFPNLPPCLVGVVADDNFSTTASKGIGSQRNQQRGKRGGKGMKGMPPGLEKAARTLGVSGEALFKAMRKAGGRHADLAIVAKELGLEEDVVMNALPSRPRR